MSAPIFIVGKFSIAAQFKRYGKKNIGIKKYIILVAFLPESKRLKIQKPMIKMAVPPLYFNALIFPTGLTPPDIVDNTLLS